MPVANPAGTTQVNVSEPVGGQDGIVLTDDGRLVATSNSGTEPRLVAFASNDNWTSAQRAGVALLNGQATTAAIVGDEIWAVHPHFADAEPPTIERGDFQYASGVQLEARDGLAGEKRRRRAVDPIALLIAELRRQEVAALAARELEHAVLGRAGSDGHAQHGAVARRGDAQRDHRARQRRARQRSAGGASGPRLPANGCATSSTLTSPHSASSAPSRSIVGERLEQHLPQERGPVGVLARQEMRGPLVEQPPQHLVGERPAIDEAADRPRSPARAAARACARATRGSTRAACETRLDRRRRCRSTLARARAHAQAAGRARRSATTSKNRGADLLVALGARVELHREEVALVERALLGEQLVDALRAQRPHPHAADGVGLARRQRAVVGRVERAVAAAERARRRARGPATSGCRRRATRAASRRSRRAAAAGR